ncbi:NAD(P)H-binding protein [Nonomuraea sp. NPDC048892]|uniref:NAD(P)H-binding protein n=1 Tax=Nonomuraea sp. NPDC048892 TaxID=3154624 RepID=UPI0033EB4BA7
MLVVVIAAAALDLLDGTITNLAAPAIVADLGGGQALVQWLGAGYALAMGVLLVTGGRLGDRGTPVAAAGAALLGAAMLGLLYGLIDGSAAGWSARPLLCLTGGLAFAALFCLRQVTARAPLIEPSLLLRRGFTAGLVLSVVFHAAVAGLLNVLALYLQAEAGPSCRPYWSSASASAPAAPWSGCCHAGRTPTTERDLRKMTTLVTGARGAVATALIGLLRERGLPVRPASSTPADPSIVRCDLRDPSTFAAALAGVTSVFLYAEPAYAAEFAQEAADAGVEHIVLLSSSSVLTPEPDADPLARSHVEAERALTSAPVRSTLLRPGAFCGNAFAWARTIKAGTPVALPYPEAHVDAVHEADLAAVAAAVLADPGALGGRAYNRAYTRAYTMTGPQSLTFADQIAALSRAIGREIVIKRVSRQEWKEQAGPYVDGPVGDALLDYWESRDGRPAELTPVVEELTGRPARTFASWAEEHRSAFIDGTR